MHSNDTRWEPNRTDVAARVLDGEAVIIHLGRGTYYSMDKVGAVIWERLDGGGTLVELTAAIVQGFRVSAEEASRDLERLLEQLIEEDLILEVEGGAPPRSARPDSDGEKRDYAPPVLRIYRDMADLMVFLEPPTPGAAHERFHSSDG